MIRSTESPISLFIFQLILEFLVDKSALRLIKYKVVEDHGEGGHGKPQDSTKSQQSQEQRYLSSKGDSFRQNGRLF